MAFWGVDTFDSMFWEDETTRNVLLTIDSSLWKPNFVNLMAGAVSIHRFVCSDFRFWVVVLVLTVPYIVIPRAIARAIKRDPVLFYRQRGKIMLLNRLMYICMESVVMLIVTDTAVVERIHYRLAVGTKEIVLVLWILVQTLRNHHPWSLYFPLPFKQSIWLDILQQAARLVVVGGFTVRLLEVPQLRPAVTSMCTTMNVFLNTDLISVLPMASVDVKKLDSHCVQDGPLLLTVFVWGFWGCFWPTFTVWYAEFMLKKQFMRQQHGIVGAGPDIWGWAKPYLLTYFIVASAWWPALHVLLAQPHVRDLILRIVLYRWQR